MIKIWVIYNNDINKVILMVAYLLSKEKLFLYDKNIMLTKSRKIFDVG